MEQLNPNQLISLAAAVAVSLSRGLTDEEVQTMVNLFNLITDNLTSVLQQRTILQKGDEAIPVIPLTPDD